jgi:hypothetical protein
VATLRKVDRVPAAIRDFKSLIRERFPNAEFSVVQGFDPPGTFLEVRIDTDDFETTFDEIFDSIGERLIEYQLEGPLALTILPIRPREPIA